VSPPSQEWPDRYSEHRTGPEIPTVKERNPRSKITELAAGQTHSPNNTMIVELVEPDGMPAVVRIGWPVQHTLCDPPVR
jgi:hypothetical protein